MNKNASKRTSIVPENLMPVYFTQFELETLKYPLNVKHISTMAVLMVSNKITPKKYLLLMIVIIIFNTIIPSILAEESTISSITIENFPLNGDITTDIFVKVRGVPYICGGQARRIYIYFDDMAVVQGQLPNEVNRASWDASITVPNLYPYSELGTHTITATVEASDGTRVSQSSSFDVVNHLPPPKWWQDLPQDFIDSITGPAGERGSPGPQGIQGEPGESYPVTTFNIILGASAAALLISIIGLMKSR